MMNKEEAAKLVLANKKMKLEFIPERRNAIYTKIHPDHIASSVLEGCRRNWELPLSNKDSGYVRILTPDEQKAFEILLDKEAGSLSFFNIGKESNFWNTQMAIVNIGKDGYTYDLSNPVDNIKYRVLCIQSDVCDDWERRLDHLNYKWAFKEEGYTSKVNADFAKLKKEAYLVLDKLSLDKQRNILIALGVRVPDKVSEDFMINKFEDIITNKEKRADMPSVKEFLEAVKDKGTDDTAFIQECLNKKIFVYRPHGKYEYDGELIVKTGGKQALIDYLNDIDNQEFKETVKHRLKNMKND